MTAIPLYVFNDSLETGISDVPDDSFFMYTQPSIGTTMYRKLNSTNVTETTTISDFVLTNDCEVVSFASDSIDGGIY